MLLKQTKIVASISDRRCDVDFIKQLFEAGMNVVRMNTAHASREGFEALIANVRSVSNRIAILMDTKGPEVRTTANAEPIPYQIGDKVKIVGNPDQETTRECIAVSYPNFVNDLNIGGMVLIDDALVGAILYLAQVGAQDHFRPLAGQLLVRNTDIWVPSSDTQIY